MTKTVNNRQAEADWNERHQAFLSDQQALRASTTLTAYQARVLALIPGNGDETEQHTVAAQIEYGATNCGGEAGRATKTAVTKAFKALYAKGHVYSLGHEWPEDTYTVTRIVSYVG
jgi:hypothetical protein|tara:strand:- start:450 stop:797 length:348 start_codon:yes stop_codon:yes gene_type:complete